MKSFRAAAAAFAVAATFAGPSCTKPNPRSCADGICNDPNLPFCDVDGTLGGEPKECIAVSCTPSAFETCRGENELRCNATGNDYDTIKCEIGCSEALDGCRLCEPNETRCTNGTVATCDANGTVNSMSACSLGCFEDQPRCRDIAPSNNLAQYLDMVSNPPDVDLTSGGTINTTSGNVSDASTALDVPSFLVPGVGGAPGFRVFVVNTMRLGDVLVNSNALAFPVTSNGPALAVVAKGDITVVGQVAVRTGDVVTGSCIGGRARVAVAGFDSSASGSGGGGNASAGAAGGSSPVSSAGAAGAALLAGPGLVPLRGGCGSGGIEENGVQEAAVGVRGGGAIQLSSRTKITIDGSIDANGTNGDSRQTTTNGAGGSIGGGAGGGILLEAPSVTLGPSGSLLAKGGNGFGCTSDGGVTCMTGQLSHGAGGTGATRSDAATSGGPSTASVGTGGGGGGGLGRIHVNTATGTFVTTNTSVVEGELSYGNLATR